MLSLTFRCVGDKIANVRSYVKQNIYTYPRAAGIVLHGGRLLRKISIALLATRKKNVLRHEIPLAPMRGRY